VVKVDRDWIVSLEWTALRSQIGSRNHEEQQQRGAAETGVHC